MVYCMQLCGNRVNFGAIMADLLAKPEVKKSLMWVHSGYEANKIGKLIDESQPIWKKCS